MNNKIILIAAIIVAIGALLFLGNSITGYFAQKVSYEDLCKSDADCSGGKTCCVIYEGYGLCNYKDYCQSIEFLCKNDADCEPGTVCCISEGMEQGICNYEDKCMSIELFNEYTSQVKAKVGLDQLSPEPTKIWPLMTIVIIITIWFIWKVKPKQKAK